MISIDAPDAHLVQMQQQVGRIIVDPVSSGALQFFTAISPREEADAQRPGPSRGEHVPDAVTDDHRITDVYSEPIGSASRQAITC